MFRTTSFPIGVLCWLLVCAPLLAADAIDFGRDVLPLLSDNCFQCHGPDQANREAGLRLDQEQSVLAPLESGATAVVPGDGEHSELVQRIKSNDPALRMPPPDSGKSLTAEQVKLLTQWVEQGAGWAQHWAYTPPLRPDVPDAPPGWRVNNPIDGFIQRRLQAKNLSPADRATKETRIRRVTLDLTGLPPTLAEVDAFLADDADGAYERVVDRLLASERYAEHMARIWLDAARYGDTHGLHLDNERSIWPYRDWVIQSFHRNQPFDQFTIEQLAGDLLPQPTLEQRVATGFNRCNVTTSEGGSIDEEYYVRYAVDRVETTATVWLGLTAGCAACHDHKFDPLTQKEFYELFSYYFSLTERAMDGNALLPPPFVKVPTAGQAADKTKYKEQLAAAQRRVDQLLAGFDYQDPSPDATLGELVEDEVVWFDDELPPGAKPEGNGPTPWKFVGAPDHPVHSGAKSTVRRGTGGGITQHFFTGAANKLKIEDNSILFAYVYLDPEDPPQTLQLQFNDGSWDHRASWGADKAFLAGAKDARNRLLGELPAAGKWVRLEVPAEKVGLKPGAELNGWAFTQVDGTVYWDCAGVLGRALPEEQRKSQRLWEQFYKVAKRQSAPAEIEKLLQLEPAKRSDPQRNQLTRYFLEHVHPEMRVKLAEPTAGLAEAKRKLAELEKAVPGTLVMEDRKEPRQAHVLERGEYTMKREPVSSSVPTWLAPAVSDAPPNRLGLAQWLVQPQHPLTARVTVNRFWQQLFGTGLVRTSEDFGVQGERPSHPELLDWLAVDFVESGWDVKRCLKQMAMSATYQQASKVSDETWKADPGNRLLARGPRFRLDAEVLRDQALAISGLLSDRVGGRSVKPYQPAGLWKPVGFGGSNTATFVQDHGDKLYRRSMYTFWKRTSPPPSMATFDAPNRETCQVRRARTNTPLQALVLMNDVQFVEAARKFAERLLRAEVPGDDARIAFAFRAAVARRPDAEELQELRGLLADFRRELDEDQAEKLLSTGESPVDESLDEQELAAWTMVAHLLFNLSEFVTRG